MANDGKQDRFTGKRVVEARDLYSKKLNKVNCKLPVTNCLSSAIFANLYATSAEI